MSTEYDLIKARYDTAITNRSKYEGTLSECGKYTWPLLQNIIHEVRTDSGELVHTVDIYDSTQIHASDLMAKGILGNMMPVGIRWFELVPEDDVDSEDFEIRKLASEKTDQIHKMLWQHNFIQAAYMTLRSMIVFTFGTLLHDYENKNFRFFPIRDILFECDSKGFPDTVYRKMSFNARQAKQEFGDAELGKEVGEAAKEGKADKFEFVHAVFPNGDYDGKYGSMKYASKILNLKDGVFIDSPKYRNGYDYMPYKIIKYSDNYDDDNIGYCPTVESLPDIKMLNEAAKTFIECCEKEGNPPVLVESDSVIGQPVTSPGGLLVYRKGAEKPEPMKTGSNPQLNQAFINNIQQQVRESYMSDVFDAVKYYRRETAAELKQIEIEQRVSEGYIVLAPVVASIQKYMLEPVIMDIFNRIDEEKIKMKIVYQGRLSLAMSSMQTDAIETVLAKWTPYDEKYNVFDTIDMDDAFKVSALNTGVPAKLFKDEDVVAQTRTTRNAPAEAMADASIMAEASQAYKNVAGV